MNTKEGRSGRGLFKVLIDSLIEETDFKGVKISDINRGRDGFESGISRIRTEEMKEKLRKG